MVRLLFHIGFRRFLAKISDQPKGLRGLMSGAENNGKGKDSYLVEVEQSTPGVCPNDNF